MRKRIFTSFVPFGRQAYSRWKIFAVPSFRWKHLRLRLNLTDDWQLIGFEKNEIPDPPDFPPELLRSIRTHIDPRFTFKAYTYTYVETHWSSIFGDFTFPAVGEQPRTRTSTVQPGPRQRLIQIFEACAPGTYGYYAKIPMKTATFVVGNLASADVDRIFAAMSPILNQSLTRDVEQLMNVAETKFWDTRKDIFDYAFGQLLGEKGRGRSTQWTQAADEILRGPRVDDSGSPAPTLSDEQVREVTERMRVWFDGMTDELDPVAVGRVVDDLITQGVVEPVDSGGFKGRKV